MSLKKPRIHLTGISNIDYKSKQDIKKIFNNFKNYSIKKPGENLIPDEPQTYKYPNPNKPNLYNVSLKDAITLSGDSLMYAQTYKIRNEIKQKKLENDKEKKLRDINALSKVYNNSKNINDETKKYSITEKSEDKKVSESDQERIRYLRKCIKKQLAQHKDVKTVFLLWQSNYLKNHELSIYDLHKRINELGVPITYNEAIGLVSFANKRNTNDLNYDEFKNLFFDDRDEINQNKQITEVNIPKKVDISKIEEENKKENENKDIKLINSKVFQNDHYLTLETMLHVKNSNFLASMNDINDKENNKNGNCDFLTFKKVLDTLKIPEKYKNISIARSIYNEFKIPDQDLMNYANFIEKCKNLKQPNDFFEFQNNYLNLLSKKLVDNEGKRKKYQDILLEDDNRKQDYVKSLNACKSMKQMIDSNKGNIIKCITEANELNKENEINLNKNYNTIKAEHTNNRYNSLDKIKNNNYNNCTISYDNRDTFSHYQPTFNFIDLMYKDSRKHLDRYKEGVKEFSPIPVIIPPEERRLKNNRFLSVMYYQKYKRVLLSSDPGSPAYIDNKERFQRNDNYSFDEKKKKMDNIEKMNKYKNEVKNKWDDIIDFQQKITDVKESLGQIKRTKHLFDYENRVYERNKLQ